MLKELDDCNSGQPTFNGAELTDGCVKYHVTFSTSTKFNDPPVKPLPQEKAKCASDGSSVIVVAADFWQGVAKKFCKDVGDGKTAKKEDLRNTDLQTRPLGRSPAPSSGSYSDWKIHFEWEQKKGDHACCLSCNDAMTEFVNDCKNLPTPTTGNLLTIC
jgi:hypothetical protein